MRRLKRILTIALQVIERRKIRSCNQQRSFNHHQYSVGCGPARPIYSQTPVQVKWIVIAASTVLDGKAMCSMTRSIEGAKITAIDPKRWASGLRLRGLTVLPGWIDSCMFISPDLRPRREECRCGGTTAGRISSRPNAWVTLMAGFTTVQKRCLPADVPAMRSQKAKSLDPGF